VRERRGRAAGLAVLAALTVGSHGLGKLLSPADVRPVWIAPLACCIFAVYLGFRLRSELSAAPPAISGDVAESPVNATNQQAA
jgi:hypothetical protein